MKRTWTNEQLDAINARGGSVLVSAAAGSGKTAVLVQRVIERLTDEKNPTKASRLLIVTFTRAAAGEMRERISGALEALLRERPKDANLINQQMLLPSAKICTIDSFCSSLVKENFQLLDIASDFKTADEGELGLLRTEAMDKTLEEFYAAADEDFLRLVEILFEGKDDKNLADMIYRLYEASMSYPSPEMWLDCVSGRFEKGGNAAESDWGQIILSYASDALNYCLSLIESMRSEIGGAEGLERAFLAAVESDEAQIKYMLEAFGTNDWDASRKAVLNYSPLRLKSVSAEYKNSFEEKKLKQARESIKTIVKDDIPKLMCCTDGEFLRDTEYLRGPVKQLCLAAKSFSKNFLNSKKKKISPISATLRRWPFLCFAR